MVEKNILGLFFLTFIAVLVPKAYSNEKLVQTASLQDLRVAINSGDVFNLDNFFEGYNLTYALEGEFSNNMTQSAPAVSKKIELAALTAKASETVPNNNFQDLYADPVDQNSFYVIEDRNFTIWQVNDLIPSVLTSFMMPFASNIVSAIPIAAAGTVYMPVIQSSPNGFMASLVNVTSKDDIQNMESMSLVVNAPGTIEGANVYSNYDSIFYFLIVLAKENQIYIVHYDLVAMQVQLFNIITPAQIGSQLFSPINVVFDGYNGLICDSTDGIYQFSAIEYLYTANQTLVITEFFQDTQDFGELFSCRLENSYLSIGTSSGIALYGSASLNYIKKLARYQRPYESYILNNVVRLGIIEGELFSGYYVSNTTTSFRISVLNTQNDEDLVFDIPTYELFGNDSMIDPTPPYMILNPHESDALLIIFSTPNSIWVYTLNLYSYFSIGSSPSTYVFNGTVTVSNLNEILYSAVLIQGVDPRDYTISYIRGNSPADGFLNPDQIELLTNVRILEDNMSFLLPLTNYLSGQDITYSMFLEEDIPGCLTTIILPPKYTLEATSNLPDISFYPYLASILGQDNQFLIAVPGTSASAYVYTIYNTRTTLISTLRCQDSSKTASLAAGAAFSYTFIIIECYSEDSNTGFYNVDWDLYSIQNGITVTYLKTWTNSQTLFSQKIDFACSYFYVLRGNQIEVYNFAPEISQVTLTSIGIIDSDSFPLFEEFEPIEIVQDYYCELLVYDFSNGLVVIGLADDFDSFNFTSKGLIGNIQNSEVKMAYNCSRLVITPTGSNSDYGLVMLDRITNLVSTFPVMPGCSYSSISITLNFIAVFCDDILDNRVLVFDWNNQYPLESLYTSVSVEKSGSIITNFDANDLLYIYTGENIFTFILGQTGPDFNLYYSNYMIPTTFSGITTWALILFNYTEPPSSPIQEAILVIIASNKLDEGSITLYFNPISRGSYVLLNELYDTKSNILTSGEFVKVIEQEFTTAVPVSAFYGNNINFYLVHKNGTTIQSVGQCDSLQPICILGKTSLDYYLDFQNVQLEAFDMTENNGVLYASIENMILAYDMKSSPYSLLQIYNLTNINGAYSTSCHRIQAVPNVTDVLIVSCNYFPLQTSSYYFTYLAALDLNNLSNNNLIPASYLSIIIEVILDEGMVTVYVHDRQDIKVYELTGFNVKYLLVQYAEIDPEFFGLDTFYINSIMYINHTDLLLIEENTGFIWLKQDRVNNGISFLLYAQIAVTSLVADYPFVKLISAVLLSDKSTILANDVKGNNYYLLLRDGSVIDVYNTIPSINSEYNMWINSIAVYESKTILAYPYSMLDSGDVFVRVLNYSLISKNAIYTDFLIPATAINDYYVDSRIFIQDSPKLQALTITIQSKTSLTLTSQISVFTLRLTPLVTYNPIGTRESAEMQLLAYIPDSGSQVTLGSARVEFDIKGGGTSGSDDTSTKWYDEWWLWVIILGSLGIILAAAIGVWIYLKKTKIPEKENLIETHIINA